ncbi:hypothetical protein Tco_0004921 [Tanacetum coccineum]
MTSPNKPTSKPSRVAKMSVKPIWRKKPNLCNTSNVLNTTSPIPKPLTPHHEPSQENNHPNQALPNPYIKDTPTSPQVVSHPPLPILPINSHIAHTQAPYQSNNQTQHTPPLSPSRESLLDDINQLQDLSNLLAMHRTQQQNNIPSSPYSPNLPHILNINQVETHVGYCPCCIFTQKQFLALSEDINWIEFLLTRPRPPPRVQSNYSLSAEASTGDNGGVKINATIDGHSLSITEGSLRRHLKLADQDGITSILNLEIFEQLVLMGYHTDSDKLTFQKGVFSPQWRITSSPSHSPAPSTSHSPEPEPSTQHSPNNTTAAASQLSPTQPSPNIPSPGAEKLLLQPYDLPLHAADLMKTKKTYSSAYTKLILRVKKLESQIKIRKARRQARVVLSDDEVFEDDSSKQGRKLSDAELKKKAILNYELFIQEVTSMNLLEGLPEKMKSAEKMEEDDVAKETGAKRKKSIPRKSTRKRQKMDEDCERRTQRIFRHHTKRRASSKNYKILSEMLEDFDRLDVEELYRLVKERYSTSRPEGFDLMLWGDLHTLFEPDEDDEIWKDQHEYNLISWRLCDFYGIHILLMENGLAIHMLTEKKYPLSQEMISKMLKKKLEVDHVWFQRLNSKIYKISSAEVKEMFERIISRGRRLEDFIQKKLDDLKDNHKFRGGLLGINLHKT